MNITFTRPYMNKKRQEYGLPKIKYIREVWIYGLLNITSENRNYYMGTIECETDEYGAFDTGFDMKNNCAVLFNKEKFSHNTNVPIENANKSLYPGFTKDLIELYHNQLKTNPNCMTEFINIE